MRDYVKKQLAKCHYADLSDYDERTNTYHIPKYSKPRYEVGKMYLVKLSGSLVDNADSAVATNWNGGTSPKMPYLKIYVSKMLGRMLQVDSICYDYDKMADTALMWSGWLPVDELTQLSTL